MVFTPFELSSVRLFLISSLGIEVFGNNATFMDGVGFRLRFTKRGDLDSPN